MEVGKWAREIKTSFRKYKYVFLILLIGIALMMLPDKQTAAGSETAKEVKPSIDEVTLSEQLEDILSNIHGAGQVKVMLTIEQGERIIYQTDTTYNQGEENTDTRTQTIIITDSNRNETGLVHQKNPPKYQGAIILAQGADDPLVKLALVDAVMKATGLGADKISVLKMK